MLELIRDSFIRKIKKSGHSSTNELQIWPIGLDVIFRQKTFLDACIIGFKGRHTQVVPSLKISSKDFIQLAILVPLIATSPPTALYWMATQNILHVSHHALFNDLVTKLIILSEVSETHS